MVLNIQDISNSTMWLRYLPTYKTNYQLLKIMTELDQSSHARFI